MSDYHGNRIYQSIAQQLRFNLFIVADPFSLYSERRLYRIYAVNRILFLRRSERKKMIDQNIAPSNLLALYTYGILIRVYLTAVLKLNRGYYNTVF